MRPRDKYKRAARRMAKLRKKARAYRLYPDLGDDAGKLADNLTPCSCHRCGSYRRNAKGRDRLTVQELREFAGMDY